MDKFELAARVDAVREKMQRAALRAGRRVEEILLCAACKAQTDEAVLQSAGLEIDVFGENRAQELMAHQAAGAYGRKPCHFIGALQTNKVRQVVGRVAMIQSVDREKLLRAIAEEAARQGLVQDILLEVNLAGEESKAGVSPEGLRALLEMAGGLDAVRVRGLMAIPPALAVGEAARPYFAALRELKDKAGRWGFPNCHLDVLSMGMSGSYEAAIMEGATLIRVGRDIFGERPAGRQ